MNKKLEKKLQDLPKTPGVYLYKDKAGEIIYVGKAAVLRHRVRQYFQTSRVRDAKTDALIADIADLDWIEVDSELDALFLEAELVRRYMPRYNILLRDDKSMVYVRISYKSDHPTVTTTRRPLDDGAEYFGPYFSTLSIRKALKLLRRAFPYSTHTGVIPKRACLQYHLGLCPGLEEHKTTLKDYRANLKKLMRYLKGDGAALTRQLEKEMKMASGDSDFESAAKLRDQVFALRQLKRQIVFSDREFMDMSRDQALDDLTNLLGLDGSPKRVEGFDISHMSGTDTTASMVVFRFGLPDKREYRKFKLRVPGNDDFAHMHEALTRRLKADNVRKWQLPDLLLIDGGKGQLGAALQACNENQQSIPAIGLAKREEDIIIKKSEPSSRLVPQKAVVQRLGGFISESDDFWTLSLPKSSHVIKLLQRIRDESHRFAVSYHSVLKVKRQTQSVLDEIPGIGPKTKKKLLKTFGSLRGVKAATTTDLELVVGARKAEQLKIYLKN